MSSLHVCHITTVHPWKDIRIFQRMCCGLAEKGLKVTLVAPHTERTTTQGVQVIPTGLDGKLARLCGAPTILPKLRSIGADVYHFHDPELLPWMFLFQMFNRSAAVIYDVHEYQPEHLLHSNFFGIPLVSRLMSHVVYYAEPALAGRLRGVIGVTSPIADRFTGRQARVQVVRNLVKRAAIPAIDAELPLPGRHVIVVGGTINRYRSMDELVAGIGLLKERGLSVHLLCIGKPLPEGYDDELRALACSSGIADQVHFLEKMPWETYQQYVAQSCVGPVLYANNRNNQMGVPARLYEYMANGLPIVASDFPEVAKVLRDARCGILIDSSDPRAVADAIEFVLTHPEEARRMGENGRQAVRDRYCWERELDVLLGFYEDLTATRPPSPASSLHGLRAEDNLAEPTSV